MWDLTSPWFLLCRGLIKVKKYGVGSCDVDSLIDRRGDEGDDSDNEEEEEA